MTGSASNPGLVARFFKIASKVEPRELKAVCVSFAYMFCVLSGYYILRPVRETMGAQAGIDALPWLYTGTFFATLVAAPIYGAFISKLRISSVLPWVYGFFIINILMFYVAFEIDPESLATAATYYIWISVFNMFVVSIFWSFMADLYDKDQARRLFGFIAAGGSLGAVVGPLITATMVGVVGTNNLLLMSCVILGLAIVFVRMLVRMKDATATDDAIAKDETVRKPLGGNPFAGFRIVISDPYMLGISAFIILYTFISTIFYFAQIELVADAFASRDERTMVFGYVDFAVNLLAILTQLFVTSRITTRWGLAVVLGLMPVFMILAFVFLSVFPILWAFLFVQVLRRAGNYAITRPGREMLWTVVDKETKYKAKNVIDTAVYRGGDLASGWINAGMRVLGLGLGGIAVVGVVVAALWLIVGYMLGKHFEAKHGKDSSPEAASS